MSQYKNLKTKEVFTSLDAAAKSVGIHSGSILRAIRKKRKCAGVYWQKLPEPIPSWYTSKAALQKKIDALRIDGTPRQIVVGKPSRYARGKDNPRYYVNIKCSKHGPNSVAKRVDELLKRNGSQCRSCGRDRQVFLSRRRAVRENGSLGEKHPNLAEEWHPTKNQETPFETPCNSNLKAWWVCRYGHEFHQRVADRVTKNTGCTKCYRSNRVSKFELRVYAALKSVFGRGQVLSQVKAGAELVDILIKPLNLAIEIDGHPWHLEKEPTDISKQNKILEAGFDLIRMRDPRLSDIYEKTIWAKLEIANLTTIPLLASYIGDKCEIPKQYKNKLESLAAGNLLGQKEFMRLMSNFPLIDASGSNNGIRSLQTSHPEVASEWGDNGFLSPNMVTHGMSIVVNWICGRCGQKYSKKITDRCQQTYGCRKCADNAKQSRVKKHYKSRKEKGINLFDMYPELAKEFDQEKNKMHPRDASPNNMRKFWWICPKGCSYESSTDQRTRRGHGCPYCSGHRAGPNNNLLLLYPEVSEIWDFERNDKTPDQFTSGSYQKVHWKCPDCGLRYKSIIKDRIDRENGIIRRRRHKCG